MPQVTRRAASEMMIWWRWRLSKMIAVGLKSGAAASGGRNHMARLELTVGPLGVPVLARGVDREVH